jgi:NAD(P)-dependent dehydrogenase (short-subunit alcohol dehydrogenase family)
MGGEFGTIPEADWEWVIRVNLMGVVHGTEIFAPLLAQHGEGGHNSVRGTEVCIDLASRLGLHVFDCGNVGSSFLDAIL